MVLDGGRRLKFGNYTNSVLRCMGQGLPVTNNNEKGS